MVAITLGSDFGPLKNKDWGGQNNWLEGQRETAVFHI